MSIPNRIRYALILRTGSRDRNSWLAVKQGGVALLSASAKISMGPWPNVSLLVILMSTCFTRVWEAVARRSSWIHHVGDSYSS
jgi:branched-subunit amino acid permease